MDWNSFDTGHTIGQAGSENGIIVRDEVFQDHARITLERDSTIAPFAITCGIFGWMVHTRYFANRAQADLEFENMKDELARIANLLSKTDDESNTITLELENFIKLFP